MSLASLDGTMDLKSRHTVPRASLKPQTEKETAEDLSGERKGGRVEATGKIIYILNVARFLNSYSPEKGPGLLKTTTEKSPRLIWLQFGGCSQTRSESHRESSVCWLRPQRSLRARGAAVPAAGG